MVMVNLQRPWFGPNSVRYHPDDNPHDFPDAWAAEPEQGEDESDEDFELRTKKQKYAMLPASAKVIEGGTEVLTLRKTANGSVVPEPTAVNGDVKSVGNTTDEPPAKDTHDETHRSAPVKDAAKAADEAKTEVGGSPSKSGPKSAK